MAALDNDSLRSWVGRSDARSDTLDAAPIERLSATLDRDDPVPRHGDALPPLWHWLYFLPLYRQSDVGPDGHARRGGFLPPVPLPRRMWAGSRIQWHRPLTVGANATRKSHIVSVKAKRGRAGELVFVVVRHEISVAADLALTEEHDIVYRGLDAAPTQASTKPDEPEPRAAAWVRRIVPDDVLLFRYSALTFNSHRIHYDRRYATEAEGYPGLVVHGPLLATLLVDLWRRQQPGAVLSQFEFRALRPLFDTAPFDLCGQPENDGRVALWAQGPDGAVAMRATATCL
jgi:3-methylfumaryl-CoA hydratase